jgi:hypothetical protein
MIILSTHLRGTLHTLVLHEHPCISQLTLPSPDPLRKRSGFACVSVPLCPAPVSRLASSDSSRSITCSHKQSRI